MKKDSGTRRLHGEGSAYFREDRGQWVAVADLGWRNGSRDRREFTSTSGAADALDKRADFLARRRDGFTMPKGRPPTVGEYAHHWLYNVVQGTVRERTWQGYRGKTELHIIPYWSGTPLTCDEDGINEDKISEWHRHLQQTENPLSAASIGQCHRILSMILKTAVIRGRMMRNPASNATPPAAEREEPMPPDEDEIHEILLACEDRRTGPRWVTGLATGARQGEVLGLLWPCADTADLDSASVAIEWELARLPWQHGCEDPHACGIGHHRVPCATPCPKAARTSGRRHACVTAGDPRLCPPDCTGHARACPRKTGGGLVLLRPKSAKSRRTVPVGRAGALALRRQRQLQLEERVALGPDWRGWQHHCGRKPRKREVVCPDCRMPFRADDLVFTQPDGRPADPHDDWEDWGELLQEAGVDYYRIHDGRHSVATGLLEDGVDIRVVQEIMGHATPDFTRRAYQHVRPALQRAAADAIDRRLTRGTARQAR